MSPGAIIDVMVPDAAAVDSVPANTDTQLATVLTSPLSVNGVPARRSKAPKLSGALAAHSSSRMFKTPSSSKPKAICLNHHFSEESRSRGGSTLKAAAKYLKNPGMLSLGGGLPSSEYFPFETMSLKVPNPPGFSPAETRKTGQILEAGRHDYRDGKSLYDIHIAFNYCQSVGAAQLLRFVTEHTEIVHDPPYEDWACSLTVGSTSAYDMLLRMLCTRGDSVLSEEYTFASAVETGLPMGVKTFGVDVDEEGLRPDALEQVLSTWDEKTRGYRKPRVLYTVPSGQNPTGATQSTQRRREVYAVCQKHDVIILEDEPYYFLQMDPYDPDVHAAKKEGESEEEQTEASLSTAREAFLKALVPSYLSMDVEGRVVRLDSFSKVVAPGSRTGWITASEQLVERYNRHGEVSTQSPSGMAQLALFKLLDEAWGHAGYLDWLRHLRAEYSGRRNVIVRACDDFLPQSIASWRAPMAGMFHWIGVDWRKHPRANSKRPRLEENGNGNGTAADDNQKNESTTTTTGPNAEAQAMLQIEEEIFLASVDEGSLVSKGSWFRAEQDGGTDMFFRATFAAASEEEIREAIRRFGVALRKSFELEE